MEPNDDIFDSANNVKANFEEIYNLADPRRYYRTLGPLDYSIPTIAKPVFRKIIDAIGKPRVKIVDVGCSYGVNAAMIRYNLDFTDLVERYDATTREVGPDIASVAATIIDDAAFYKDAAVSLDAHFTGVDVAREAAGYAKAVGLLDETVIANLETGGLGDKDAAAVADADLIITTGAVGYVTETTFARLLDAVDGPPPWVAAFSLRQFPFDPIAASLAERGLQTERLENRLFRQRRFRDETERAGAIEAVESLGLDPAGIEATGSYFARFSLAKPPGAPSLATLGL